MEELPVRLQTFGQADELDTALDVLEYTALILLGIGSVVMLDAVDEV